MDEESALHVAVTRILTYILASISLIIACTRMGKGIFSFEICVRRKHKKL